MPDYLRLITAGFAGGAAVLGAFFVMEWWSTRGPRGRHCPDCGDLTYDLSYHKLWCELQRKERTR